MIMYYTLWVCEWIREWKWCITKENNLSGEDKRHQCHYSGYNPPNYLPFSHLYRKPSTLYWNIDILESRCAAEQCWRICDAYTCSARQTATIYPWKESPPPPWSRDRHSRSKLNTQQHLYSIDLPSLGYVPSSHPLFISSHFQVSPFDISPT